MLPTAAEHPRTFDYVFQQNVRNAKTNNTFHTFWAAPRANGPGAGYPADHCSDADRQNQKQKLTGSDRGAIV